MSRGLGTRQRHFLAAMAKLEVDCGPGDGFAIYQIINTAGALGLDAEATARKTRKDAERAERREARRRHRLEVEALAASGDADAQAELKDMQGFDAFLATGKRLLSLRRGYGSPPRVRNPEDAEHIANPSRTLALLEQRGLIERCPIRGRGASAVLTHTGRVIGQQTLDAMQQA
jgi:hypothetical protein